MLVLSSQSVRDGRCCAKACTCPQPSAGNLLANPGFEADISNWNPKIEEFQQPDADARWTSSDRDNCGEQDTYSGAIEITTSNSSNIEFGQCLSVTPGESYNMGGSFMASALPEGHPDGTVPWQSECRVTFYASMSLCDSGKVSCWSEPLDRTCESTCCPSKGSLCRDFCGPMNCGQATSPTGEFVEVVAGAYHSCGLLKDGGIRCWGANWHGQTNAPPGKFKSIRATAKTTCAVSVDGKALCWGAVPDDQPNLNNVALAQANELEMCTLGVDGGIGCTVIEKHAATLSALKGKFRDLTVGDAQICATRDNGAIACVSQVAGAGTPDTLVRMVETYPEPGATACALAVDGSVICWGNFLRWEPVTPQSLPDKAPLMFPLPAAKYEELAVGDWTVCARQSSGHVECAPGRGGIPIVAPKLN